MRFDDARDAYRLDEIDRRIIHARNTSAPMIADDVSVSSVTIRHRISRLEEHVTYHSPS